MLCLHSNTGYIGLVNKLTRFSYPRLLSTSSIMPRHKKSVRLKKEVEETVLPSVESVLTDCHKLSLPNITLVRDALNLLIDALEYKEQALKNYERAHSLNYQKVGGTKRAGYLEVKTINGCGPYLYLRVRQGKILHSFYLGKEEQNNSD